jgi:hypothetical protein
MLWLKKKHKSSHKVIKVYWNLLNTFVTRPKRMQQIQLLTSPPSPGPEEQTELVQVSTELQKGSSRLWCNVQHPAIWWQVRVQHFPWDILGELGLIRGDIICIIWYLKKYFKKYIYI